MTPGSVVEMPIICHLRRVTSGLSAIGNDIVHEFDSLIVEEELAYLLMMTGTWC